jgi:hypothetical protein
MLTPQQVKPYILHSDTRVANFAMSYFSDAYIDDEELMTLFLERLSQVQSDEPPFYLHHAYQFPHTPTTISKIVELIKSDTVDAQTRAHLSKILVNASVPLLEVILPELNEYSNKLAQAVKEKIKLTQCSDDQLVDMFNSFIKQAEGKYYNEVNIQFGETLVELLAQREILTEAYILEILSAFDPDNSYGYDIIFHTKLAGEMRLASAIPLLNNFMTWDEEVLPDEAATALVKIGSEEVIHQVAELFATQSDGYYRLFASDIFGHIKLPVSESTLFKLLEQEEDETIATKLADGLCQLGSKEAIPIVLDEIMSGYDSSYLDLRESLYVNCILNEVELPELHQWKIAFEEEDASRARRAAALNGTPIMNKEKKIGRNDPCTCGSGKKHKKCCGA